MNDILRTFRLGTINLLGVTIPGLMFLLLLILGCFAPCLFALSCWLNAEISLSAIQPIGSIDAKAVAAFTLVAAYVIGYIFRLSTPDVLDKISANLVLQNMRARRGPEAPAMDHWPYRGEPDNKFPYFHFRDYLRHRKHHELAAKVGWDSQVRSKAFVNKMKFELALRSPTLSAIVDSNEAHVRLMFGTWLACRLSLPFVAMGLIATAGAVWSVWKRGIPLGTQHIQPELAVWFSVSGLLLLCNLGAILRIENLFHYRRVRELFDIVECYHLACEAFELDGSARKPMNKPVKEGVHLDTPPETTTKSVTPPAALD